jgi:hypothetical protein
MLSETHREVSRGLDEAPTQHARLHPTPKLLAAPTQKMCKRVVDCQLRKAAERAVTLERSRLNCATYEDTSTDYRALLHDALIDIERPIAQRGLKQANEPRRHRVHQTGIRIETRRLRVEDSHKARTSAISECDERTPSRAPESFQHELWPDVERHTTEA